MVKLVQHIFRDSIRPTATVHILPLIQRARLSPDKGLAFVVMSKHVNSVGRVDVVAQDIFKS